MSIKPEMKLKYATALAFVLFGLLLGIVLGTGYLGDNSLFNSPSALAVLFICVTLVVMSSVIAFSQLLDGLVVPIAENLATDVEDDIKDLAELRPTTTIMICAITSLIAMVFALLVFRFHKLEAHWGWFPVGIATIAICATITFMIVRTDWFQDKSFRTPFWVYLIPMIGIVVSTYLGIIRTEDVGRLNFAQPSDGYTFAYQPNYFWQGSSDGGESTSFEVPECSGKNCGYVYLVIFLVVLTIVLIIGSAFIPHFWLLAGGIFITIMVIISIHELRVREYQPRFGRS